MQRFRPSPRSQPICEEVPSRLQQLAPGCLHPTAITRTSRRLPANNSSGHSKAATGPWCGSYAWRLTPAASAGLHIWSGAHPGCDAEATAAHRSAAAGLRLAGRGCARPGPARDLARPGRSYPPTAQPCASACCALLVPRRLPCPPPSPPPTTSPRPYARPRPPAAASSKGHLGPSWYKCDPKKCKASRNCQCPTVLPPGKLAAKDTPQFIVITHDDAVGGWVGGWARQTGGWAGTSPGSYIRSSKG